MAIIITFLYLSCYLLITFNKVEFHKFFTKQIFLKSDIKIIAIETMNKLLFPNNWDYGLFKNEQFIYFIFDKHLKKSNYFSNDDLRTLINQGDDCYIKHRIIMGQKEIRALLKYDYDYCQIGRPISCQDKKIR